MIKILFVCHGNICRSPMAEYVMKDLVKKSENFKSKFHRPLMRWNLLLHEWSLIFHIFVLCS